MTTAPPQSVLCGGAVLRRDTSAGQSKLYAVTIFSRPVAWSVKYS